MNGIPKIKLAMFDLDGTLFDTVKANYLAYKEACGDEFPVDEKYFAEHCMSRNYRHFLPELGVPENRLKEIHDKKIKCYRSYFSDIKCNDNLFAMAELMKNNGTKLCIVTTASEANTRELLEYFDREELFDLLVTQEKVKNQKPAPDGYIYAMNFFEAEPSECVIFEDSQTGIQAASASGASVYCIVKF